MTSPNDIPVVILCGGMGTRLREVTESIPKPLVDIGEQADPVAHHEALRPLRVPPLRAVPRLQELGDQGVLPPLPRAPVADFTIRLRGDHDSSSTTASATRTGRSPAPRPACSRAPAAASTGCSSTSTRPRSCSPTATASARSTWSTAARRRTRRPGRIGTVTGVRPTQSLRRARAPPATRCSSSTRSRRRPGLVSGGFFVFEREFLDSTSTTTRPAVRAGPAAEAGARRPARRVPARRVLDGHGHLPRLPSSTSCGTAAQAPWKVW